MGELTKKMSRESVGRYSSKIHDAKAGPTITKTESVAEFLARGGKVQRQDPGPRFKLNETVWMDPSKTPVVIGR